MSKTIAFVLAALAFSTFATDYNITLVTDNAPDFTDIQSYLRSITSQHAAPQDKAIAVWRWSQRLRKQTAWPDEGGHEVLDPILFFTSYGYTQCGIISGIDNSLWLNLGWKAHYVQLGDHTVSECSWDDGKSWHMFDNSMSFYCFNDEGAVASVREIEKNPRFYLENFAPECGTNPVKGLKDHQGWRQASDHPVEYNRTLANGMDSFLPPNSIMEDHLAIRWGRTYGITLRQGEKYTRYFANFDANKSDPRFYRPLRGKDVEDSSKIHGIRANGLWSYNPDLGGGLAGMASRVFKINSANVVTSARITFNAEGDVSLSVSRDAGSTWQALEITRAQFQVDAIDQIAGVTEYFVKVEVKDKAKLNSLSILTHTQLNRAALPRLVRGPNRVQLRLGDQVETTTLAPPVINGQHKKNAFEEQNVDVNPKPYFNVATLRPAEKGKPGFVTWKIDVPTPIIDVNFGGNLSDRSRGDAVKLLHSWNGKDFVEDFKKSDGAMPWDAVVLAKVEKASADAREVFLRYQFESTNNAADWKSPGIQTALMTVHHEPLDKNFVPIVVKYKWIEHRETGDVTRGHVEIVNSPNYEYKINVGGFRDPTMESVTMELLNHDVLSQTTGYSDSTDVGPSAKAEWALYKWGKNLALGKPYTLEGKQDDKNPDAGGDLTDGIVAPPETYVSKKWMPTNVMFEKDVSPVATIDLGAEQTVAAVRVQAGQEGGFHLTYPETILVETSRDGKTFERAGSAAFNQVFNPPADFAPWELESSKEFESLPAGGRLAYAFRIIFDKPAPARYVRVTCTAKKDWGLMLSELQVYDDVKINRNVPPMVVLPALK